MPRKTFHFASKLEKDLEAIEVIQRALEGRYVLLITPVAVEVFELWQLRHDKGETLIVQD